MKLIKGPVNCVLCGHQIWNMDAFEGCEDGNEKQYICYTCHYELERCKIVTSKEEYEATISEYEFDIDRRHDGETI